MKWNSPIYSGGWVVLSNAKIRVDDYPTKKVTLVTEDIVL